MPKPAVPRDDAALEVLFHPFDTGALAWPRAGGALFLRARDGWPLHAAPRTGLVCEQSFKPAFDALQRSGFTGKLANLKGGILAWSDEVDPSVPKY